MRWENSTGGEDPVQIRKDLQTCMQNSFSVFREGDAMATGLEELKVIRERLKDAHLADKSSEFNTQRIECLELDNLMETAFRLQLLQTTAQRAVVRMRALIIQSVMMRTGYVTSFTIRKQKR